jgi:hypothetical protein
MPIAERRAMTREPHPEAAQASVLQRYCLGCLAPLANGGPVCSDQCNDVWWDVPTVSGELWTRRG